MEGGGRWKEVERGGAAGKWRMEEQEKGERREVEAGGIYARKKCHELEGGVVGACTLQEITATTRNYKSALSFNHGTKQAC